MLYALALTFVSLLCLSRLRLASPDSQQLIFSFTFQLPNTQKTSFARLFSPSLSLNLLSSPP